jgi:hypothetical protein
MVYPYADIAVNKREAYLPQCFPLISIFSSGLYLSFIREIFTGVNRFFHFNPADAGKTPYAYQEVS